MEYKSKQAKHYPVLNGAVTHPQLYAQHAWIELPVMPLDILIDEVIEEPREDGFGNLVMSAEYARASVEWLLANSNLRELERNVRRFDEARYVLVRRTLRRIAYHYPLLRDAVSMVVMEQYQPSIANPVVMPEGFNASKEKVKASCKDEDWMLELLNVVLRENTDYILFETSFGYSEDHLEIIRANCYRAIAPCFNFALYGVATSEAEKVLGPSPRKIRD